MYKYPYSAIRFESLAKPTPLAPHKGEGVANQGNQQARNPIAPLEVVQFRNRGYQATSSLDPPSGWADKNFKQMPSWKHSSCCTWSDGWQFAP
ncbi:MAG: hypothetical protein JW829_08480, partial [Pirellulales bacterium]|nr:hypothetical protein [Pirellulales bacterium]